MIQYQKSRSMKLATGFLLMGLALAESNLWAQLPARCVDYGELQSISLSDWESGLGSWTAGTYQVASPGTFDTDDWAVVGSLPDGRDGQAAFVANLDVGDCGDDDESGVLTLTSPAIEIPSDTQVPRVSVHHWFLTEYGWDGGNLKISVNGGSYTQIPPWALDTGHYTATLFDALDEFGFSYNTNPLAEQWAFTGPEGDGASGNWVESRVNLYGYAEAGDTIRLRLDFGVDACFGKIGWYVDEIEVYSCPDEPPPTNASLDLTIKVTNDNGGTAQASDWMVTASGLTPFSGPGPDVSSGEGFVAGTYDLALSEGVEGYTAGDWDCVGGIEVDDDTVAVSGGESVSCTVVIDDDAPALTLVKKVINDDGGSARTTDWTLSADGPSPFSGRGPQVFNGADFQVGTYDLSEYGGPPAYLASDWVCDGGTPIDGDSVTLALGDEATCTVTNDDFPLDSPVNAGHAGAWFNPETSGQGFLIDVEPSEQFMFLAWFTFADAESASPEDQRWLTAQGNYSGAQAELILYETLGGAFDDPQDVETTEVGQISLVFPDCEQGFVNYRIEKDGLQGQIPVIRAIPGSGDLCHELGGISAQAVDINAGMDGAWFDPETPGQGFLIDAHPDPEGGNFIFVAWFTYGEDTVSGQRWLTAQGGFEGPVAEIDVYETTGGLFDDPAPVDTAKVGSLVVDFTDCSNAQLAYVLDAEGLDGDIAITRAVPGAQALCEELAGIE